MLANSISALINFYSAAGWKSLIDHFPDVLRLILQWICCLSAVRCCYRGERAGAYRLAQGLALTAALIASLALVGYIHDVAFLYSISSHTGMALHTALIFIALSLGILFIHPEQQLMLFILSDTAGGMMVRRLLPASIAIPIVAGGLIIFGARAGLYDMAFAVPLCVVASISCSLRSSGVTQRFTGRCETKTGRRCLA